jgi:glycosyltransferase involved in cell wall biosynthesis
MRVAIVHYWLLNMRGGEKVVEALCRLFPQADIFTLFYEPDRISPLVRSHAVKASFLNPLRNHYRKLLPLMPMALEHLDLRGYDLVISSESGPAKGVILNSATRHVCYCHTPMRYLWDLYPDYLHEWTYGGFQRALMALFSNYLRLWDFASAARVDQFIANSANVQRRIQRTYRRDSTVIHPPVEIASFHNSPSEDYYLVVSELVAYKRIEHAVIACNFTGRKLRIIGDGPEYRRLRLLAGPSIEFCGKVSDQELRELFSKCRALLQPGEEDFGITSVEALASGKPVVALGRGGILEVASDNESGFFYQTPVPEALNEAITRFEAVEPNLNASQIQHSVSRFSEDEFARKIMAQVLPEQ